MGTLPFYVITTSLKDFQLKLTKITQEREKKSKVVHSRSCNKKLSKREKSETATVATLGLEKLLRLIVLEKKNWVKTYRQAGQGLAQWQSIWLTCAGTSTYPQNCNERASKTTRTHCIPDKMCFRKQCILNTKMKSQELASTCVCVTLRRKTEKKYQNSRRQDCLQNNICAFIMETHVHTLRMTLKDQ